MKYKIENCKEGDADYIIDRLVEYNLSQVPARQEVLFDTLDKMITDDNGKIIAYIENNLCGEIDTNKIAEIAICPYDKFKRFFSYMTNMSVSEYIRKRRLTLAAYELLKGQEKIIDLAVKYGYSSADSFTRAFAKQHSVLPTEVSEDIQLKVYPLFLFV